MSKQLIAFCGRRGSGKSTCANYLVNNKNYKLINFAEALKDLIAKLWDLDRELLNGFTEESREWRVSPNKNLKGKTPVDVMQFIGGNSISNFDNEIWVDLLDKKYLLSIDENLVVGDMRYVKEAKRIKERGGVIVYIDRPGLLKRPWLYNLLYRKYTPNFIKFNFHLNNLAFGNKYAGHNSELVEPLKKYADYIIVNDGSAKELLKKVEDIFND